MQQEQEEKEKNTKKIKKSTFILSMILVACMTVGVTSGVIFAYEKKVHQDIYNNNEATKLNSGIEQLNQLYYILSSNYVGEVDSQELIDGAMKGMTAALDDPYSAYLSGKEMEALEDNISGSFEGIGASMFLENDQPVVAEAPIKDSPAEKAGLQPKDVILKVDDEEVAGEKLSDVVSKIRGKKGTDVKLTIKRGTDIFDVVITRDVIPVESVYTSIDENNPTVGLISISNFSQTTSDEFDEAVTELRSQGATSFIIDVRGNPGGLLDQVEKISSRFLEDGQTIVQFENKAGQKQTDVASKELDNGDKITEPVIVLIDENSASASEILAGALNQSRGVVLIGKKTFGKGTVQTVLPVSSESELKLTTMKWLTPDGSWIHQEGIEPTIEADYPEYAYLTPVDISKSYQLGDANEQVKSLNQMLAALGYLEGEFTSYYSEATQEAVKKVQEKAELPVTGIADRETILTIELDLRNLIRENDQAYLEAVKMLSE